MALLRESDRQYTTPEDICAHLGEDYDTFFGAANPPIYQTSLFTHTDNPLQYYYTRTVNPTTEIAERKIAALEGGEGGLVFGSGMAAISAAMLHFTKPGCHMVVVANAYGGATGIASGYLPQHFGTRCTLVAGESTEEILDAVEDDTSLIYLESPSSLIFRMQDLDAITAFAKERGIATVMDNTYSTPIFQKPLSHGVDVVVHSASKYLGGHSNIVAGAVVSDKKTIESIQNSEMLLMGGILNPNAAWLLINGLRTLPARLPVHQKNGLEIAKYLEAKKRVTRVYYPALDSFEDKALYRKYMTGCTGLMSFTLDATPEECNRFIRACRIFRNGCSWGGFESLMIGLTIGADEESLKRQHLPRNLIRIHVGQESVDAMKSDLEGAFRALEQG